MKELNYDINDPLELNLSYMTFVMNGGLFIPTNENYSLGTKVKLNLRLPGKKEALKIEGKVIWITPKNALHHVLPGIGIQFVGQEAPHIRTEIEAHLDPSMEIGGYTYGVIGESQTEK